MDRGLTSNETKNETGEYIGDPVTPSFTVVSSIWNSGITLPVTEASVGDLLKWKVEGPCMSHFYLLFIYTCIFSSSVSWKKSSYCDR